MLLSQNLEVGVRDGTVKQSKQVKYITVGIVTESSGECRNHSSSEPLHFIDIFVVIQRRECRDLSSVLNPTSGRTIQIGTKQCDSQGVITELLAKILEIHILAFDTVVSENFSTRFCRNLFEISMLCMRRMVH